MAIPIPPISKLTLDSLQAYDAELETRKQAALAAGKLGEAQFDEDVIERNELQIDMREHPENRQRDQALDQALYNDEIALFKADPENASNL